MSFTDAMGPVSLPLQVLPVDLEAGEAEVKEVAAATTNFDDPEIAETIEKLKRKD